ncbi:MAG: hypothetical protein JSW59_17690 [Phycisphaerales bacterium]|nr:MAG: hypothetical protein JSW59_17690 [Phycisphaerales bacterium]
MIEVEDIDGSFAKRLAHVSFPFGRLVPTSQANSRGFSLVEAMMIVLFLGIFAVIAVPRLDYGIVKRYRAEAAANKIVTDLRLTRRLAISNAATNTKGYTLKMLGGGPYTGYEIENNDTKVVVASHTIHPDVVVTGGSGFEFEAPLGNLGPGSDVQLTVSAEGKSFTITVIQATGAVKCAEN